MKRTAPMNRGVTLLQSAIMAARTSVLLLLVLSSLPARAAEFSGRVVAVPDGDTIEVKRGARTLRIRVFGIDCPEGDQPYGRQATQFTSRLVFGKTVTLVAKDMDDYGRIIAQVILPDGRNLGKELVKAGLAWWYRQYDPGNREMERLERDARRARRGLWRDRNPVPPWEWRHREQLRSATFQFCSSRAAQGWSPGQRWSAPSGEETCRPKG